MVPWTIYNGSFTISCKIDGQKVGSDLSYKSPHVPAELCSRLSKRNKVIAPSGKSKWVRIISFIFHAFAFLQRYFFIFSYCRIMNDSWIRYLVKTLVDKRNTTSERNSPYCVSQCQWVIFPIEKIYTCANTFLVVLQQNTYRMIHKTCFLGLKVDYDAIQIFKLQLHLAIRFLQMVKRSLYDSQRTHLCN